MSIWRQCLMVRVLLLMATILLLCSVPVWAVVVTIDSRANLEPDVLSRVEALYKQRYGEDLTIRSLPESEYNRRFELADIVHIALAQAPDYSLTDTLTPLDPYLMMYGSEFGVGDMYSVSIEAMRHDGATWLLPFMAVPVGIVYNADMLEAAGIELPREDWTWDDLVSLAGAVGDDPTLECKYGVLVSTLGLLLLPGAMGGSIAEVDGSDPGIRNEGFSRALSLLENLARERAIAITPDPNQPNQFVSREACMLLCSFISGLDMDAFGFRVGFAPCPLRPLEATPVIFIGLGLTRASGDPLTAFRVMHLMTSPEVEPLWAAPGVMPMHESSIDVFADRWGEHFDALHHFLERPVVSVEIPRVPEQYFATVVDGMIRVATGSMSAEECLDYLEPRLRQILGQQ